MKESTEILSQSKDPLININKKNYHPDIIQQVDKIISKYKIQLEQMKPKRNIEPNNYNQDQQNIFKLTDLTNTNINNYEPKNEENINFNTSYIKNKNFLAQEMEKDNIKLGSALTLEKSKVVQLLNLLKIKENEINNLKQQIDSFEEKINEIKNKYQDIINSMKQEENNKLNEIYNKLTNENNKLQMDLNENKKNN